MARQEVAFECGEEALPHGVGITDRSDGRADAGPPNTSAVYWLDSNRPSPRPSRSQPERRSTTLPADVATLRLTAPVSRRGTPDRLAASRSHAPECRWAGRHCRAAAPSPLPPRRASRCRDLARHRRRAVLDAAVRSPRYPTNRNAAPLRSSIVWSSPPSISIARGATGASPRISGAAQRPTPSASVVVWGQQAERDTGARVYVRVTPHLHRQPIGTAPDRGREIGAHDHLHAGRRVRGTVARAGRQCVEAGARIRRARRALAARVCALRSACHDGISALPRQTMRPDRSPMLTAFPGIDRLAEPRAAHAGARGSASGSVATRRTRMPVARRVSSSLCTIALLSGARWEAASSARIA